MPDLTSLILPYSKICIADPCGLQTWSMLWLRISGLFHIGYPGKYCFLSFMNSVGRTLEFIALNIPQRMGPYFLGISFMCGTFLHVIWVSWFTPNNPVGCWPYRLPFLWTVLQHTHKHGRGLPVGVIWVNLSGKWRFFMILPVIIISIMKLSSLGH